MELVENQQSNYYSIAFCVIDWQLFFYNENNETIVVVVAVVVVVVVF